MPRYIDADKLIEAWERECESATDLFDAFDYAIEDTPTADVTEVKHGEWKRSGPLLECQRCGEIYSQLGGNADKDWNYCPSCGAKMDGGQTE